MVKKAEIDGILNQALIDKKLTVEQLDTLLEDDKSFNKTVRAINRVLGPDIRIGVLGYTRKSEPETDRKTSEEQEPEPEKKETPSRPISKTHSYYFTYLQQLNNDQGMTREEEYAYSKRMEFFKERMSWLLKGMDMPKKEKEFMQQNLRCPASIDPLNIRPHCRSTGRCAVDKEKRVHSICSSYNQLRSQFVERNLYQVIKLVQAYRTYGVPLMDLIQEGNTALIRAVEKFEWRRGVRLQTYAEYWVRQAVERCISANKGIVRVPNYIQQKMRRFKREGKISTDSDRITTLEVSKAFNTSKEVAGRILETGQHHISLNGAGFGDENGSLSNLVPAEPEVTELYDEKEALKLRINEALTELNDQERTILYHRFGMNGAELKTLGELGTMMNVSRERIRQIFLRTLERMKKPKYIKKLQAFV